MARPMRQPPPTCVLLIGVPASGKSSFYRARFADTHVRINRDMLGTAHRVRLLRDACLAGRISFVLDNTNVTIRGRLEHIEAARAGGFRVEGYFLESRGPECADRNRTREERQQVPDSAIREMSARLELPSMEEGFDGLFLVRLVSAGEFDVREWTS